MFLCTLHYLLSCTYCSVYMQERKLRHGVSLLHSIVESDSFAGCCHLKLILLFSLIYFAWERVFYYLLQASVYYCTVFG